MPIVKKIINGYTIHAWDDAPVEEIFKPIKSASENKNEISSWARLLMLEKDESALKNASMEGREVSSWGRLMKLRA